MENSIFIQLSLVIVIATVISIIMRLIKQPLIIGYILTGIIVGPSVLHLVEAKDAFHSFSEVGITLLLFIIGLGMNPTIIKNLGKPAVLTAGSILLLVGGAGLITAGLLGLSPAEAILVGIALFFSSTIIILKVISDKREISRLYAQIAIGVIVVDDIVATIALLVVATIASGSGFGPTDFAWLVAKGIAFASVLLFIGAKVMPRIGRFFAHSQEFLLLFAVGWGMGIASLSDMIGFSLEVGALIAGISLASLPYATEMASRLKPLRDFFILLFFVVLGESFVFSDLSASIVPALILSAIVIIGKPIFVMASLGALGYTKFTSFKAGIHLSQISEFSMILILFAGSVGIVSGQVVATITLVALITIAVSTYLMFYDDELYKFLHKYLQIFERKDIKPEKKRSTTYPLILLGYKRGGHEFVRAFREMKKPYIVIDYDPGLVDTLDRQHINHLYGDATDFELLEELGVHEAEMIVSTITDFSTTKAIIETIHQLNRQAIIVVHADSHEEAAKLYYLGATYVILPHLIGSERIGAFMRRHGTNKNSYKGYRKKHLVSLGKAAVHRH